MRRLVKLEEFQRVHMSFDFVHGMGNFDKVVMVFLLIRLLKTKEYIKENWQM